MRVAVVSPYSWLMPSGVNTHVTNLAKHLERRGHEVWIIAPAGGLTRSAMALPENFIIAGRTIPVRSNGSVVYANAWPLMLQKMSRILARHDFDLVHVHEPAVPSVGAAATMVAKVPVVGTFHAAGEAHRYYARWKPLAARILASITVGIAVSESARRCVAEHFPADYRVIPNGIDIDEYARARDNHRVKGRILFVGRPDPRKGLPTLIEAFDRLQRRSPEVSLALVGPTREELQALMARSGRSGPDAFVGVEVLGRVSHEEKLSQLGKAEILCAPSLGGESFGIVLIEGLAAGVPVVASDIPGYRAVLGEGSAGVLVPPGDARALEQGLSGVLEDGGLRCSLSVAGISRAQRYSWDQVIDEILEVYGDAIRRGPRVVEEHPVPALSQTLHFLRMRS